MGLIFGKQAKKNQNPVSSINEKDRAILQLKNARDKLKKFKKKLEFETISLQDKAIELYRNNKISTAVLFLKFKKHKEFAAEKLDNQLLTLMKQINDMEWALVNVEILKAIEQGTETLNKIHEEISLERVQSILNDAEDEIEVENRINELLTGDSFSIDNSYLLSELEKLDDTLRIRENTADSANVVINFPIVPDTPLKLNSTVKENIKSESILA